MSNSCAGVPGRLATVALADDHPATNDRIFRAVQCQIVNKQLKSRHTFGICLKIPKVPGVKILSARQTVVLAIFMALCQREA